MNRTGSAIATAALALGLAAAATEAADGMAQKEAAREAGRVAEFAMYTQWMDAFRTCGMETPGKLPKLFLEPGSTAELAWKAVVEPNFLPGTQADFFRGAIPLAGPFSARKMVAGLYNPHWDAIMLFQMSGELPHDAEGVAGTKLPQVSRLLFMSGEAFRGERPGKADLAAVLPGGAGHGEHPDEPLSPGLWRVQAGTMRRFNGLFPAEQDDAVQLKGQEWEDVDADRDMEMLLARVAVRLKCLEMMDGTPEALGVAHRMQQVLQFGSRMQMKRYFPNPRHDTFVTTYARLPREMKRGFVAYGYVPAGEGSLYLLVNREYPRLYATVSVPRGRVGNPDAGDADFEWYDLDMAEELLDVWESGREGR